jgi:hypothetical protein
VATERSNSNQGRAGRAGSASGTTCPYAIAAADVTAGNVANTASGKDPARTAPASSITPVVVTAAPGLAPASPIVPSSVRVTG